MLLLSKCVCRLRINVIFRQSFQIVRRYSFAEKERKTAYERKYMRNVLQRTSGCILFDPTKGLKSNQNDSCENTSVSKLTLLITSMNENYTSRERNVNEKIAKLQNKCLDEYKHWPINTQLFALDAWHWWRGARDFPIFEVLMRHFLGNFHDSDNGPALQIMYYVAWSKWCFQSNEVEIVTTRLEKQLNRLTLDEVSIFSLALIKSGAEINDVDLITSLCDYLISVDFRKFDDIAVSGVIKAVRRFATTHHIKQMKELQKKLVPFADSCSLLALTNITQLGLKQRVFNPQLIATTLKRFSSNLDQLRMKDVERALLAISTFNRSPTEIEKTFCANVQKNLLNSLDTSYGNSLIRCISYLAVCRMVDSKLVDWALDPKTHSSVYGKAISGDEHALLLIDSYAKINLAGKYTGHRLPDELCAQLMQKVSENDAAGDRSRCADEIAEVLKSNGRNYLLTRPFPYVPFPDVFLVYNKRANNTVSRIGTNVDGSILNANKLFPTNNPDLEAVAIIPCLQRQTVFNSSRFNGLFQLKIDQLHMMGFKTIVILKNSWNLYGSFEAKRRLLALELCKNDIFLLNKCFGIVHKSKKRT